MAAKIADIRKNYSRKKLSEAKADPHPLKQFAKWWKQAVKSNLEEANAMIVATASPDGVPSARIVLLKGVDEKGFIFFTNYNSFKGQQLLQVSLVHGLHRKARSLKAGNGWIKNLIR